jgi:phosphatidylserine/phosphatidylglycerophosphate/cardiolipin synthase-like enzyme
MPAMERCQPGGGSVSRRSRQFLFTVDVVELRFDIPYPRWKKIVKLLIQPGDGLSPLLKAIDKAKNTIEILIFRFDRTEMARALENAVKRGVAVHALIAHTSRGGEKSLRKLEMRFLAAGITVARTDNDLVRYHGKMLLVDRQELHLLAFNFTYMDIENSRSFGVITRNRQLVKEAAKLFVCDTKRERYRPGSSKFLVSPVNARKELASFLKGARKELLIYDPHISDHSMVDLLQERASAGVRVRIIGGAKRAMSGVAVRSLNKLRLHARLIIRDRDRMFLGSQSLRELELDARREIGILVRDAKIVPKVVEVFEADWQAARSRGDKAEQKRDVARKAKAKKVAKRVTKAVSRRLPPVAPVVEKAVKQVLKEHAAVELKCKEVEESVRDAVEDAVKVTVRDLVEEAVNGAGQE